MNEKFFNLPEEKQRSILNAGYRVFSQNPYKKSPMREIADEAGISKALLFHYFSNKKELYLFLWMTCARTTWEYLTRYGCFEHQDLFDIMSCGLQAKISMMRRYPNMGTFAIQAYYEKDPEVRSEIQASLQKYASFRANAPMLNLDPERFIPGIDLQMMYQDMYRASVGYIWEKLQGGELDVDEIERDFTKMIDFWKSIYLRKEG